MRKRKVEKLAEKMIITSMSLKKVELYTKNTSNISLRNSLLKHR